MKRTRSLLVSFALAGCASDAVVREPVVVAEVTPHRAEVREGCHALGSAIAAAETECPDSSLSTENLATAAARARLETCAKRFDEVLAVTRAQDIVASARYTAWATRLISSPGLARAAREAKPLSASGEPTTATAATDPALLLALRQRAGAYVVGRDLCATEKRKQEPETWSHAAEAVLVGLQPDHDACLLAAHERRPLNVLPGSEQTIHWRARIATDGRVSMIAPLDFPSAMRADIALCVLDVIARAQFPPPSQETFLGSNVTFVKR